MARRPPESLDDLLARLAPSETWEAFAKRSGVSSRLLRMLRKGEAGKRPFRTTFDKLATALGCDIPTIQAAIAASRAAAGE